MEFMTFDPASVRAAIFDIGGVFGYPTFRPVRQQITEMGLTPPSDRDRYRRAHHAGVLALEGREVPDDEQAEDFWAVYDRAYGAALEIPQDRLDELTVAIRLARLTWDWVHEDNVAAFHRLIASGMPVAIVSNNDGSAEQHVAEQGVCQVGPGPLPAVVAVVDSGVVGVSKPDPAIFRPALDALDTDPAATVYVGDTVYADVVGALAAGLQVVQLDPYDDHAHYDHARAADVAEVVDAILGSGT